MVESSGADPLLQSLDGMRSRVGFLIGTNGLFSCVFGAHSSVDVGLLVRL